MDKIVHFILCWEEVELTQFPSVLYFKTRVIYSFIYLKGNVTPTHNVGEFSRDHLLSGSILKRLQQPWQDHARVRTQELPMASHMVGRGPCTWSIISCLPRHVSMKLQQKQSSQYSNGHALMGWQHCSILTCNSTVLAPECPQCCGRKHHHPFSGNGQKPFKKKIYLFI